MQVICVTAPTKCLNEYNQNIKLPANVVVGNEYFVIDIVEEGKWVLYILAGFNPDCGFDSRCFATLPGLDADEIEDAQKEAIVPSPIYN